MDWAVQSGISWTIEAGSYLAFLGCMGRLLNLGCSGEAVSSALASAEVLLPEVDRQGIGSSAPAARTLAVWGGVVPSGICRSIPRLLAAALAVYMLSTGLVELTVARRLIPRAYLMAEELDS